MRIVELSKLFSSAKTFFYHAFKFRKNSFCVPAPLALLQSSQWMLITAKFSFYQQPSLELRCAAREVSSVELNVVARSVELNGNFFVLVLGNYDVDVQHGGGVEGDVAALER